MNSLRTPVIALTGGIGSGKSEAAKQFAKLGIPVVDTDIIAHELTAAGQPMLAEISRIFGADYLTADGTLDRAKLRTLIFNNPTERLKLEALMHPAIYERALEQLADNENRQRSANQAPPAYQILVVPLLFENNRYSSIVHKTLVIDCDENLQVKRTMARSQLTATEVKTMINAQIKRSDRLNLADEVIENNGSLEELIGKITEIHKKFIKTCIVSK